MEAKFAMLPSIIFDTSAINALEDAGADSAPLMRMLAWEFEVILSFTNAEELISTASPQRRESLICRFERLLRPGRCIFPPAEIIRRMISTHLSAPAQFDWTKVEVKTPPGVFEGLIARREGLDDAFCLEQRVEQLTIEKKFKELLKSIRPTGDAIPPEARPTFQEVVMISEADGQSVWNLWREIYRVVSGRELTEVEIKAFIKGCPPVNAASLGEVMGVYGWSLRGQARAPGRNDLMMAAYLPYCDRFVTNDYSQREALRKVADEAELACEILSFEEFKQAIKK
jgi:hypothetical protein